MSETADQESGYLPGDGPTQAVSVSFHAGGLHRREYAIDAAVCAVALAADRPVTVLTSDPEDITMICGPAVTVVAL